MHYIQTDKSWYSLIHRKTSLVEKTCYVRGKMLWKWAVFTLIYILRKRCGNYNDHFLKISKPIYRPQSRFCYLIYMNNIRRILVCHPDQTVDGRYRIFLVQHFMKVFHSSLVHFFRRQGFNLLLAINAQF